jgi:hypothetical protein
MIEARSIIFDEREVITALLEYSRRKNTKLPPGTISGLSYVAGRAVSAELSIESDDGAASSVTFPSTEVAAALLLYCMNRKIRLPLEARKTFEVVDHQATLMFEMRDAEILN